MDFVEAGAWLLADVYGKVVKYQFFLIQTRRFLKSFFAIDKLDICSLLLEHDIMMEM